MDQKIKIAYITGRFPCVSLVFQQNEILGLMATKADVCVLSCRNPTAQEISSMHDFARPILEKVIYPNYRGALKGILLCLKNNPKSLLTNMLYLMIGLRNPLAFPKIFAAFLIAYGWYPLLLKKNCDWIHADFGLHSATAALFLSKLLKRNYSYKVHAGDIYNKNLFHIKPLKRIKAKQAGLIFAEHDFGRQILAKSLGNYLDKIKVNYSSVRTDDFKPLAPVSDSKRFVALGRLVEKKGFKVLVQAAAILKDQRKEFIIDIYGSGPEENVLGRMIQEQGLRGIVNLKGFYDNNDLKEILANCLALIMPSIMDRNGDMDGVPTVIYEAMALGRAVIASRISGIPEIVHDNSNGYLVEPGDATQLAHRMSHLLKKPNNCFVMGKEGRRLVEKHHNYVLNAQELLESFQQITSV